jgi:hypothetical protein
MATSATRSRNGVQRFSRGYEVSCDLYYSYEVHPAFLGLRTDKEALDVIRECSVANASWALSVMDLFCQNLI